MYVCLSVWVVQFGSHWTAFHEILSINRKSVKKILKGSVNFGKNNGYLTQIPIYISLRPTQPPVQWVPGPSRG